MLTTTVVRTPIAVWLLSECSGESNRRKKPIADEPMDEASDEHDGD